MVKVRKTKGICDVCGWTYDLSRLKFNSYGLRVCPTDYDGKFDMQNHPQNKSAKIDKREIIRDVRPETNPAGDVS